MAIQRRCMPSEADLFWNRIRSVQEEDPRGSVSGGHGTDHSPARAGRGHRAVLSEARGGREKAHRHRAHAAHPLSAARAQPFGPGAEEASYGSRAMRRLAGIDPEREPAPDETMIVDASIIQAPSSTKNRTKARGPQMHSTEACGGVRLKHRKQGNPSHLPAHGGRFQAS